MTSQVEPSDPELVKEGERALRLTRHKMPVLDVLRDEVSARRPLRGHRVSGCVHLTKQTGVLIEFLLAAGAEVAWTGGDEKSTQDDIAAALAFKGVRVFGHRGMTTETVRESVTECLDAFPDGPTIVVDNGAQLLRVIARRSTRPPSLVAATEKTAEGVRFIREELRHEFDFPVLSINNLNTKWEIDNTHGTGQSTLDGILRATNMFLAGKRFLVCGFGHVGRGLAHRARGMGARVTIACRSQTTAVRARLAGFTVADRDDAVNFADIVCTATGYPDVISGSHFDQLPSGAVLCNTGRSAVEINLSDLHERTLHTEEVSAHVRRHVLTNGRYVDVLSDGGLVNLDAAEGNPSEVMDLTFTNQALAVLQLSDRATELPAGLHEAGSAQDEEVARRKLSNLAVEWDHTRNSPGNNTSRDPSYQIARAARGPRSVPQELDHANRLMPVLDAIRRDLGDASPLAGHRIVLAGPVTAASAIVMDTVRALGGLPVWCALDLGRPQFDSTLADHLRVRGDTVQSTSKVAATGAPGEPTVLLDDHGVLVKSWPMVRSVPQLSVERSYAEQEPLERLHAPPCPLLVPSFSDDLAIVAADSAAKAILDLTSVFAGRRISGETFVVVGYGRTGARVAARAAALGARVIVCEVRAIRALLAVLDGYDVQPLDAALATADIVCSSTGKPRTITQRHVMDARSGTLLVGNRPGEIEIERIPDRLNPSRAYLPDDHDVCVVDSAVATPYGQGEPEPLAVQDLAYGTQIVTACEALREPQTLSPMVSPAPAQCAEYILSKVAEKVGFHSGNVAS